MKQFEIEELQRRISRLETELLNQFKINELRNERTETRLDNLEVQVSDLQNYNKF